MEVYQEPTVLRFPQFLRCWATLLFERSLRDKLPPVVYWRGGGSVPNKKSAAKALRVSERRRLENALHRGKMRSAIKRFRQALGEGNREAAEELLRKAVAQIDKAASKKAIHKRQADRRKSRLMKAYYRTFVLSA